MRVLKKGVILFKALDSGDGYILGRYCLINVFTGDYRRQEAKNKFRRRQAAKKNLPPPQEKIEMTPLVFSTQAATFKSCQLFYRWTRLANHPTLRMEMCK